MRDINENTSLIETTLRDLQAIDTLRDADARDKADWILGQYLLLSGAGAVYHTWRGVVTRAMCHQRCR